jgi:hypothetical protein
VSHQRLGGQRGSTWTRVTLCNAIMLPRMMYRTAGQGGSDLCPCISSSCILSGLVLSFRKPHIGPIPTVVLDRSVIKALFVYLYSIPSSTKSTSLPFSFLVPSLRLLPTITQNLTNGFVFFIGTPLGPWQRRMSVGVGLPAGFRMIKETAVSISDKIICAQSRDLFFARSLLSLVINHSLLYSSIVERHSSYPNSIPLFARTIRNLESMGMRANWQRSTLAPATSTFASHSISISSSSSVPKTTFVVG